MWVKCNTCNRKFKTYLNHHSVRGDGCTWCSNHFTRTPEEFIAEHKVVHGEGNYYYHLTKFVDTTTFVTLIHVECGNDFDQDPKSALAGCGCPYCAGKHVTTESWIESVKKIGNNAQLYGYEESEYKSNRDYVKIFCNRHCDYFWQRADHHKSGHGCSICNNTRGYSQAAITWLESVRHKYPDIQHAETKDGEFRIPGTRYKADGYSPSTILATR